MHVAVSHLCITFACGGHGSACHLLYFLFFCLNSSIICPWNCSCWFVVLLASLLSVYFQFCSVLSAWPDVACAASLFLIGPSRLLHLSSIEFCSQGPMALFSLSSQGKKAGCSIREILCVCKCLYSFITLLSFFENWILVWRSFFLRIFMPPHHL